jgi:hypothetical protein
VTAVQTTCGNDGPEDLLPLVDFQEQEDGSYQCPAGRQMEYKGTCTLNKQQVHHYVGTGCDRCELKDRCTEGKKRHLYINVSEKATGEK